ncbi:hypothetical protein GCK32_013478 [Trichostrongylus colubriformis]|uniref:CCHC-type domain-containing protein n=1 Tax=Trichostrongylus colubriformis TaxID=6319 RepID=A0AAN8FD44_TRICO
MEDGDIIMMGDENVPPQEVSQSKDCQEMKGRESHWEKVAQVVDEGHSRLMAILGETKTSKQAKTTIETEWAKMVEKMERLCSGHSYRATTTEALMKTVNRTLTERKIECEEDWDEYVATMERDGELLAELSHMLNVNIFQIKDSVAALLRHGENQKAEGAFSAVGPFGYGNPGAQSESLQDRSADNDVHPQRIGPTADTRRTAKRDAHESSSRAAADSKKCYNCSKYGHVARECPLRATRVNHIDTKDAVTDCKDTTLSSIVSRVKSMGMAVRENELTSRDLIGRKMTVALNLLGENCEALVDTGSMISIVPVELLAKVQDKGFDLDSLEMIPKSNLKPVFDASNNRMEFVAAVYIEVKIEGGMAERVAFHISPRKETEVILGTNALNKLGISVLIEKKSSSVTEKGSSNKVKERWRALQRKSYGHAM